MKIIIAAVAICLLSWGCKKHNSGGPIITTVAGNGGDTAFPVDGAMATDCNIKSLRVATDHSGNFYFADFSAVYKVTSDGRVHRIAGNPGTSGYSGDNGPAIDAQLGHVNEICCDKNGNLYLVDDGNNRIRKVDIYGIITTIAGNGMVGFGGDGGLAINAKFNDPEGIAVDQAGNLFVADYWNFRIRKINTSGVITTIAGTGVGGYEGDGGQATAANVYCSLGIAIDASGNIFFESGARIRKIATNSIIMTIAGNGTSGFKGDGGPATAAEIDCGGFAGPDTSDQIPSGIAIDQDDNLYFTNGEHQRLRKIDKNGLITTIAGTGYSYFIPVYPLGSYRGGFSGDGGAHLVPG